MTKSKGIRKPRPAPEAFELGPEALELDPEAIGEDEDLDENELVTPSGDGYYILGSKKNRNFW